MKNPKDRHNIPFIQHLITLNAKIDYCSFFAAASPTLDLVNTGSVQTESEVFTNSNKNIEFGSCRIGEIIKALVNAILLDLT